VNPELKSCEHRVTTIAREIERVLNTHVLLLFMGVTQRSTQNCDVTLQLIKGLCGGGGVTEV